SWLAGPLHDEQCARAARARLVEVHLVPGEAGVVAGAQVGRAIDGAGAQRALRHEHVLAGPRPVRAGRALGARREARLVELDRVRDGARVIAPFAVAVAAFGVTFGVLARDAGLGRAEAVVFSATTFAGSAQFAATSVLSAGGTLVAAIAAAVLLNTRYIPIGLSVAPSLRGPAWKRGLRAQLVVDESWAVSHMGGGRYDA